jgi:phage terminase large subunit
MQLAALRKEIRDLTLKVNKRSQNQFTWQRNEQGNLILLFGREEAITLPLITLRPYQKEIQDKLFQEGFKRFFLVRPRRAGKEMESWNLLIQGALTQPGLYLMIYPTNVRARLVLWEGAVLLNDQQEGKSLRFLDMIPKRCIKHLNQQDMTIQLINGAVIRILGSDIDPDKLRGVNVLGAVFSEYAFSDPRVLHILMPVFRQNLGWFILQTTFNGMNHAYRYLQSIKTNPAWIWRIDSVESLKDEKGKRYITDEMIDEDRKAGMPEFLIQQEYYSIITVQHERLYFSREMQNLDENKRIIPELILPNTLVYAFYDLGVNDSTVVLLVQFDHLHNPNIIYYLEANNHAIQHYIDAAHRFCNKHHLRLHSHFLPHDGKNRDKATAKNTQDIFQELGEAAYCVPKPQRKIDAINLMRRMLYRTKFNKENAERLIDCLTNYSKIFDEKNNIYKDHPLHDWTSHAVDAYQTMTLAIEHQLINERDSEIIYYS